MHHTIIDFTKPLQAYSVISDATARQQGKSHGELSYQKGIHTKKHYFFAFLDPQPNGAAFVSIDMPLKLTLKKHHTLCLTAQGLQKKSSVFQLLINTRTSKKEHFTYQQKFTIQDKKITVKLPLSNFSAAYRGKVITDAPALNTHDIQSFGIRIIGRDKTSVHALQKGLYGLALYRLSICDN